MLTNKRRMHWKRTSSINNNSDRQAVGVTQQQISAPFSGAIVKVDIIIYIYGSCFWRSASSGDWLTMVVNILRFHHHRPQGVRALNSSSCHLAVHSTLHRRGVTTTRCIEHPQVATREYNKRVAVQQRDIHQTHRRALFRFINKLIKEQLVRKVQQGNFNIERERESSSRSSTTSSSGTLRASILHINFVDAFDENFHIINIAFKIDIGVNINNKAISKTFYRAIDNFSESLGQPFHGQ